MTKDFDFDLNARRTRLSDAQLIAALQSASEALGEGYFTSPQFDGLSGKRPHSATIIERFGSWKRALGLIGISGGRERRYSPEELIQNLKSIWIHLGYPPGKRRIAQLGGKISETPYKRHWGSLRAACEALAAFENGKISRQQLLDGNAERPVRVTIPLKDRNLRTLCQRCNQGKKNRLD